MQAVSIRRPSACFKDAQIQAFLTAGIFRRGFTFAEFSLNFQFAEETGFRSRANLIEHANSANISRTMLRKKCQNRTLNLAGRFWYLRHESA